MKKQQQHGFTLLELMLVVAIIAILAMIAVPSYDRFMVKTRMNALMGEWRDAFYFAQRESIRTKHQVTLCASSNGTSCGSATDFSDGWIVYDNNDNTVLQDYPMPVSDTYTLTASFANGTRFTFLNNGRMVSNFAGGRFTITSKKYSDMSSKVNISKTGNIQ